MSKSNARVKSSKSICEIRRRQIVNCFTSISHISPPRVCVCKSHMVNAVAFYAIDFFFSLSLSLLSLTHVKSNGHNRQQWGD